MASPDPNRVTAEVGGAQLEGRILALEGGGGLMRVALGGAVALSPGDELVLQMHDGARFRVRVIEPLSRGDEGAEFRLKLVGQGALRVPDLRALVEEHRLIAILRGVPVEHAVTLAQHLHRAGIRMLEVALSDAHGEPALRAIRAEFGDDLWLGAGTVTDLERARAAQAAGASFLLTPHLVPEVNAYAVQQGLGLISGAMTPTEIQQARAQGSQVVKLFPAGDLGVGYLKSLLGPYPDLPLLVVGNVHAGNLGDFLKAGALGAGIGSYLTQTDWTNPDFGELERRARALLAGLPE